MKLIQKGHFRVGFFNNVLSSVPKSPVYRRARPSRRAFVENRPSNARIFVILPVYLWFWAHSERYWAVWQTGEQRSESVLNHKKTTKSQKIEFHPSFRPSIARIFAKIAPVFRSSFYKNEPVWRIGNTANGSQHTVVSALMYVSMTVWSSLSISLSLSFPDNNIWSLFIQRQVESCKLDEKTIIGSDIALGSNLIINHCS